jgi:hypothetical protein
MKGWESKNWGISPMLLFIIFKRLGKYLIRLMICEPVFFTNSDDGATLAKTLCKILRQSPICKRFSGPYMQ